jgi:hypothetical protein
LAAPAGFAAEPVASSPLSAEQLPRRIRIPAPAEPFTPESISAPVSKIDRVPVSEPPAWTPVFEAPAFEPSLVPIFDPASATNTEPVPETTPASDSAPAPDSDPAFGVRPEAVPAPTFAPQTAPAGPDRRRPADLGEVAAAWRQVIEHRSAPERPADLAGYVGQNPRATADAEQPKPSRPTDLGSYTATQPELSGGWRPAIAGREARPADLGQYGQTWQQETWRRPEHLGDEPPKPPRRPATLADHLPAQRRPEAEPGEGPTRDLSGYGEQEESPEVRR